jgi:hypothetical protein
VASSEVQFRAGVIGGGLLLVLGLASFQFCRGVSLPPRPGASTLTEVSGTSAELLAASTSSPAMYLDLLARDAAAAGIPAPGLDDMSRKLAYRIDAARHVLEVGQPPIAVAGLELAAVRAGDAIGLEIRNTTRVDLAYLVRSTPFPNIHGCGAARPLPINAVVIGPAQRETRVECVWRDDMAITIARVETIELSPLSARYVSQVPPSVLGIEDQVARGHRVEVPGERCSAIVPQAVRIGMEHGEIGWRDLVDFYARHRCQTYQFPITYRAFTADGAQPLPASGAGS